MTVATSITRRDRRRALTSGAVVVHARYVLNFRDPRTGRRRQLFFRSQREAIAKRDSLLAAVATNTYAPETKPLTIAEAIEHWLDNRKSEVKPVTHKTYAMIARRCVVGPLAVPDVHAPLGAVKEGPGQETKLLETLGGIQIADLSTAEIRRWHRMIMSNIGARTASVAKTILQSALSLAAEDFGVRPPPMPTRLGKGRSRAKRQILTPAQVGQLLERARSNPERGIYLIGERQGFEGSHQRIGSQVMQPDVVDVGRIGEHVRSGEQECRTEGKDS